MFEGKYYNQKNGPAIGSSLSPIVAEIVMDKLFNQLEKEFNEAVVKFKVKYVDETFFILKREKFDDLCKFLNDFHPRIRITFENPMKQLNFLNLTILRNEDDTFSFRHYKKDTFSGRMINFYSNSPTHFNFNTYRNILSKWLSNLDSMFHEKLIHEFRQMMARKLVLMITA